MEYSKEYQEAKERLKNLKERDWNRYMVELYHRSCREAREKLSSCKKKTREFYLAEDALKKAEFRLKRTREQLEEVLSKLEG